MIESHICLPRKQHNGIMEIKRRSGQKKELNLPMLWGDFLRVSCMSMCLVSRVIHCICCELSFQIYLYNWHLRKKNYCLPVEKKAGSFTVQDKTVSLSSSKVRYTCYLLPIIKDSAFLCSGFPYYNVSQYVQPWAFPLHFALCELGLQELVKILTLATVSCKVLSFYPEVFCTLSSFMKLWQANFTVLERQSLF